MGPSGAKEATTNEHGEAEFNGLLPGRYCAKALLPQVDGKPAKNPKTDSVQLGANSKSELSLVGTSSYCSCSAKENAAGEQEVFTGDAAGKL